MNVRIAIAPGYNHQRVRAMLAVANTLSFAEPMIRPIKLKAPAKKVWYTVDSPEVKRMSKG